MARNIGGEKYGDKNNNLMCFRIFVEEKMQESPHIWGRNCFWLKPVIFRQQVSSAHGQNIGQLTLRVLYFPLWSVARFGSFVLWMIASLVWLQNWKPIPHNLAIERSILYINSLRLSVRDWARVRHGRTTGPGPAKTDVVNDWLWRWPARAGWARERGWLAVTVASTGGLGTGESLQVLCVLYIVKGEWSLPWSLFGRGEDLFSFSQWEGPRCLAFIPFKFGGREGFFFHFSLFPNVFSWCSL